MILKINGNIVTAFGRPPERQMWRIQNPGRRPALPESAIEICSDSLRYASPDKVRAPPDSRLVLVAMPGVAESPLNFGCQLAEIIQLKDRHHSLLKTWLALGEVIGVHMQSTTRLCRRSYLEGNPSGHNRNWAACVEDRFPSPESGKV